jgi:pimeloyl-ACP methyl ester carboxylesterase
MKYTYNPGKFKTTVIFIHGFRKDAETWNVTESNKVINVEKETSKKANTVLIQLEDVDYQNSVSVVAKEILCYLPYEVKYGCNVVLVTHSNGSFYAISLALQFPNIFKKLLLLDPTVPDQIYLNELLKKRDEMPDDVVASNKVKYFSELPSGFDLESNIIVRIHLNICSEESMKRIEFLYKLINKNTRSRLMVHYGVSHMLHYNIPHVIIDSIRELCK